ncbi:Nif3-like dinuclear metal center hexameric protein [Clostridium sp. B9]|uniref:Nif3-like dinuclear metal center hexameric protein n=1 Tax=Clostridium sp. B9 TaxID=3423224 RepID=UPI003D2F02E0
MKLNDIINIIENIAPVNLKEGFDNVGLMVGDREKNITKILLALDCTNEVIEEAKEVGAELILTHHPLLFRKPSTITTDTLLGKKIIELIKNDINLYSAHTNWDSVKGGLNDTLVKILGFNEGIIMDKNQVDQEAGIGRVVELNKEMTVLEVIDLIKASLGVKNLRYSGDLDNTVKRIAIVNGSGQDFFGDAKKFGADLIITGDTTYHFVSDYNEMGLNILDIGHFNSEWPVLISVSEKVKEKLDSDVEFFISKASKDPFEFV